MQTIKRVPHPSGTDVLFDTKWHQYKVGGTALRSVSKLLDRYFPFDEKRVLELVSKKTGQPVDMVKQGWSRQVLLGKNVHEYIECRLLKKPPPAFMLLLQRRKAREAARPADSTGPSTTTSTSLEDEALHGEEGLYIPVADLAVDKVLRTYDILGVEQVIAAPGWGIGGTIDFMARHRRTNQILIGDWKTTGSVASNFRFGSFETPCPGALRHLPNSKTYRYAMQVIIYGEILAREQYFEKGFFDAPLRASLAGASASPLSDAAPASPKKAAAAKNSAVAAPDVEALLQSFHGSSPASRFEYGVVQLAKGEDGGVVAEFKEVTPATVLPPDGPEMTFASLLRRVMEGEGV